MKKALFLVLLLPFIAFSQATIAEWGGIANSAPTTAATTVANYVSALNITGPGVNLNQTWNGSETSGWPNGNNTQANKYVQFGISPNSGATLSITQVQFQYKGGIPRMQVRYSKSADFSSPVTIYTNESLDINNNDQTVTIPVSVSVGATEKFYVRIYGYKSSSASWIIRNSNGGVAPKITGTVSVPSPLSGTYTIGATNANYPTITAAVTALNNLGVNGPVTFSLKDAAYSNATGETFPIVINQFPGASATNTVTFRPATNVNTTITATNVNGSTGVPAVFILKGADYVTFNGSNTASGSSRNLTIINNDNINYIVRTVLFVASNGSSDGATHNTFQNLVIRQSFKNSGSNFCTGVYAGEYGTGGNNALSINAATANNSYLTVQDNDFQNVKQGIYINGGATQTTYTYVKNNDLGSENNTETIVSPATFNNADNFTYTQNYIYNLYRDNNAGDLVAAGIYVIGNSTNGTISRNQIKDLFKTETNSYSFGGIILASTNTNANITVVNNTIANVVGQNNGSAYLNGHGISITSGGNYKIYNNSVSLSTSQYGTGTGYSAALYLTNISTVNVRNNIFVNTQSNTATRRTAVLIDGNMPASSTFDYNVLYSSDKIGYVGDNATWFENPAYQTTLSGWKTATGKEANTISVLPAFVTNTDLHLDGNNTVNDPINNSAVVISGVTVDVDGQIRNTTTPDRGADEFGPLSFPTGGEGSTGIYCDASTTWNGTSWSNGTPTATKDAIFASGNFTQNGGTFFACSIFVLNGASVNFGGNSDIIVTHSVNIQTTGSFTVESGSNLIQIEDDLNSGTATIKRDSGRLKRFDYTLWCAPVVDTRTTGYQTLRNFSLMTSNGRFYDYHTDTNNYWPLAENTAKFELARAVLIRMPNSDATPGYNAGTQRMIFHGSFTGTPNTGTIRKTLEYYSDAASYNAVGNPYPSPISITDFINANANSINGTLWLWRKTNDQTQSSYSTVNLSGYVANAAPGGDSGDGNDLIANPYTIDPKGSLNTAQGFFVKATGTNKELIYRNNMRLQTHSPSFFKSAAAAQTEEDAPQFSRVWLNATNESGLFAQALIGYNQVTTTALDKGYDSEMLSTSALNLYTVMQTETDTLNLAIQTRGGFVVTDKVALGFSASVAGTYTISIDHADGIFENGQKVYINDKAEGIVRELTANSFTFTTEAGEFNDRFEVLYATTTGTELGTEPVAEITKNVMVFNAGGQVKVVAPQNIKSVVVYDLTGKVLYQNAAVNNVEFSSSSLNATHQVVLVTVTLENQKVVSKKLMMM